MRLLRLLQLTEANNAVAALREKCSEYREQLAALTQRLDDMDDEYQMLAYRSRTVSRACVSVYVLCVCGGDVGQCLSPTCGH